MVPDKSKIVKIPEVCKNNRDFWRGMVDGDGWVSITNNHNIGLCGTHDAVKHFMGFIGQQVKIRQVVGCFEIRYSCNSAKSVARILYQDAAIFLDRKYQNALEVLRINYRSKINLAGV